MISYIDYVKEGYVEGIIQLLQTVCASPVQRTFIREKHDIFINTVMKNFRPKTTYYHGVHDLIVLDTCFYELYHLAR